MNLVFCYQDGRKYSRNERCFGFVKGQLFKPVDVCVKDWSDQGIMDEDDLIQGINLDEFCFNAVGIAAITSQQVSQERDTGRYKRGPGQEFHELKLKRRASL